MPRMYGPQDLPKFIFTSFGALVAAVLLASVLNAIWLGSASVWLRMGAPGFRRAFSAVFLCNFVFGSLFYAWSLSFIFLSAMDRGRSDFFGYGAAVIFSPGGSIFALAGAIVGHALVFSNRFTEPDGTPLRFARAATLAFVYLGICSAFSICIWLLVALGLLSAQG